MASRKRLNRSLPVMHLSEKLLTKREAEQNPRLGMTCPPLMKKNRSPVRPNKLILSNQKARILSVNRQAALSSNYDPNLRKTYFSQMYCVQDTLGEGSFGVVYKVIDREYNEPYAIKISKKCFSGNATYDDVKLLEKIGDHPNIVKYYFAWEEQQRVFMQLELCALSLGTYSKTNHSITQDQLWAILIDMLKALAHIHERGLIHLDIKPDNIMMSTDGLYKLGDFGLLFDITGNKQNSKIKCSGSEGDAKYLAKEVLEGKLTPAADIFSLGITMLELSSDLVLPINGPLWQRLRDGNYFDPCFDSKSTDDHWVGCTIKDFCAGMPTKLRKVVCQMMAARSTSRPKAKQILASAFVKEVIQVQADTARINYYEKWQLENVENIDCRPIAVCLNNNNRTEHTTPDHMNITNVPMDICSGGFEDGTTPCVTPPRKVSRVILYTF